MVLNPLPPHLIHQLNCAMITIMHLRIYQHIEDLLGGEYTSTQLNLTSPSLLNNLVNSCQNYLWFTIMQLADFYDIWNIALVKVSSSLWTHPFISKDSFMQIGKVVSTQESPHSFHGTPKSKTLCHDHRLKLSIALWLQRHVNYDGSCICWVMCKSKAPDCNTPIK